MNYYEEVNEGIEIIAVYNDKVDLDNMKEKYSD